MSFDPNRGTVGYAPTGTAAEIDVGLRQYMLRVYNYMALGVAFTGIISLALAMSPQLMATVALGPAKWLFFFSILGMGWFAPRIIMSGSSFAAQACFWVYAAMWGVLIAPMLFYYAAVQGAPEMVARAFFITTAMFAGLSLYGYTTKRNLGPMGAFLCMATIGLLIALLLMIFIMPMFASEAAITTMDWILTLGIITVFSGITAYETQAIKNMYYEADSGSVTTRKAIFGAFMLYGSFVTLFVWILHLLGLMRE